MRATRLAPLDHSPPGGGVGGSRRACSAHLDPRHRLRLGSGAAGARPPCDLGLRLALRSQKRRARRLVDGTCKRRMTACTRRGALCAAFTVRRGWSPIRAFRRIPAGRHVGSRRPWGAVLDSSSDRPAAIGPGSVGLLRGLPHRTTRVTSPHATRLASPRSPSWTPFRKWVSDDLLAFRGGPRGSRPVGGSGLFEFPRPVRLASRGRALARPPSLSPLLSHALPHEHDLNAFELRSARRRPLAGTFVEPPRSRPREGTGLRGLEVGEPTSANGFGTSPSPASLGSRSSRARLLAWRGGSFDPSTPRRPCRTDPRRRPRRRRASSSPAGTGTALSRAHHTKWRGAFRLVGGPPLDERPAKSAPEHVPEVPSIERGLDVPAGSASLRARRTQWPEAPGDRECLCFRRGTPRDVLGDPVRLGPIDPSKGGPAPQHPVRLQRLRMRAA